MQQHCMDQSYDSQLPSTPQQLGLTKQQGRGCLVKKIRETKWWVLWKPFERPGILIRLFKIPCRHSDFLLQMLEHWWAGVLKLWICWAEEKWMLQEVRNKNVGTKIVKGGDGAYKLWGSWKDLFVAFIDLEKAFDCVPRK